MKATPTPPENSADETLEARIDRDNSQRSEAHRWTR